MREIRLMMIGILAIWATGCAAPRPAPTPPPAVEEISALRIEEDQEKTEIVIEASQPMTYTSFQLTDPPRLVVELAGVAPGPFTDRIEVGKGGVTEIIPSKGESGRGTRLVIGLTQPTEGEVRAEGNLLKIAVPKAPQPAPPLPLAPPPPAEAAPPPPPATVVRSIRLDHQDGLKVIIEGDGALSPKAFLVGRNRLVVDLPETRTEVEPGVIPVANRLVRQLRVGQHTAPKKVRIVVDLAAPVSYSLTTSGTEAVLAIMEEGAKPPPERKEEPRAETPAESPKPPSREAGSEEKKFVGRRISLDFQDAEVMNILRLIADVSSLNVVVGEEVRGKMTIKLLNVPWDQALEIVLKMNNLGQIREGNIIRIATLGNIARQQDEEARAKETRVKAEDLITRVFTINYAKAKELQGTLAKNLSTRGDLTVDDRTNTLIVRDIERNVADIGGLIKKLDTQTPQVMIEARIIEASPRFTQSLGVQWGGSFAAVSNNSVIGINAGPGGGVFAQTPGAFAVNLPAVPSIGNVGFTLGRFGENPLNLDLRISAGETQELVKIISMPKITVLDNQEARIEQGTSIPFSTTSQAGTQTTFVDANLTLIVTPHITGDGSIIMKVRASNNEPGATLPGAAGPSISKKEAVTNVLVKDGETTVLGGIFKKSTSETVSGVPGLMHLPIIGWLFKTKTVRDDTSELLVFLTPRILK